MQSRMELYFANVVEICPLDILQPIACKLCPRFGRMRFVGVPHTTGTGFGDYSCVSLPIQVLCFSSEIVPWQEPRRLLGKVAFASNLPKR